MTLLGKIIITAGIVILTASSLMWIANDNWQYFAGGLAIFVGCLMSGIVVSIETKSQSNGNGGGNNSRWQGIPYQPQRETKRIEDTDPYPTTPLSPLPPSSGNWTPPSTPPPDQESDPFYGKRTETDA